MFNPTWASGRSLVLDRSGIIIRLDSENEDGWAKYFFKLDDGSSGFIWLWWFRSER